MPIKRCEYLVQGYASYMCRDQPAPSGQWPLQFGSLRVASHPSQFGLWTERTKESGTGHAVHDTNRIWSGRIDPWRSERERGRQQYETVVGNADDARRSGDSASDQ